MAEITTIAAPSPARPRFDQWDTWLGGIGLAASILLGALFLVATFGKVVNPAYFTEYVRGQGLDFILPAAFIAPLALAVEAALGVALILGVRRWWNLVPTGLLIGLFIFLTGREYFDYLSGNSDPAASCGCFGHLLERNPVQAFWQDLLVLVPLFVLSVVGRETEGDTFPRVRTSVVLASFIGVLGLYHIAPNLPLDNLATHLKPEVKVADLCVGQGRSELCVGVLFPEFEQGEHVVVMSDLDHHAFAHRVADLNEFALNSVDTTVWGITSAQQEAIDSFSLINALSFQIRQAPVELLRPLYRRLPRSFIVRDGMVTKTYDGLPPLQELARGR